MPHDDLLQSLFQRRGLTFPLQQVKQKQRIPHVLDLPQPKAQRFAMVAGHESLSPLLYQNHPLGESPIALGELQYGLLF